MFLDIVLWVSLGGEPTTYPKIVQSVAYAKELGFSRIAIATNATKLRLQHFTDKIVEAGLTRVTISMHGHTAELEDKLTRVPGNFEKMSSYPIFARKTKSGTFARWSVGKYCLKRLELSTFAPNDEIFFFVKMGIDDIRVNFVRPEGYAEGSQEN